MLHYITLKIFHTFFNSNALKLEKPAGGQSNIRSTTSLRNTRNSINAHDNYENGSIRRKNYNVKYGERSRDLPTLRTLENHNDGDNGTAESKSQQKTSIAFSTVWKMPETVNNSDVNNEADQYISNLIRDSENYEFGKIVL